MPRAIAGSIGVYQGLAAKRGRRVDGQRAAGLDQSGVVVERTGLQRGALANGNGAQVVVQALGAEGDTTLAGKGTAAIVQCAGNGNAGVAAAALQQLAADVGEVAGREMDLIGQDCRAIGAQGLCGGDGQQALHAERASTGVNIASGGVQAGVLRRKLAAGDVNLCAQDTCLATGNSLAVQPYRIGGANAQLAAGLDAAVWVDTGRHH